MFSPSRCCVETLLLYKFQLVLLISVNRFLAARCLTAHYLTSCHQALLVDTICKEKYHANNALFKEVKSGKRDRYLFSPYNINTFSSRQVIRINRIINQLIFYRKNLTRLSRWEFQISLDGIFHQQSLPWVILLQGLYDVLQIPNSNAFEVFRRSPYM